MFCDPEQLGVLKITVFCDAASLFKMCCGTRWYPCVWINYCRGEGLRVCWKATLWGRWALALKWCVSLPISALKKENGHQPVSHYNGSDDEVQTDSSCQFLGVGELLPTIDPVCQCEIQPFPCSLWFKAWKDGEDLIPHQQCQEDLGRTYRAADSPVSLPYWSGLGRSLSDVEGFSPPEWDVFTSGVLLIHRNLNVLLSASSAWQWNASNVAVSL